MHCKLVFDCFCCVLCNYLFIYLFVHITQIIQGFWLFLVKIWTLLLCTTGMPLKISSHKSYPTSAFTLVGEEWRNIYLGGHHIETNKWRLREEDITRQGCMKNFHLSTHFFFQAIAPSPGCVSIVNSEWFSVTPIRIIYFGLHKTKIENLPHSVTILKHWDGARWTPINSLFLQDKHK